MNKRQHPVSVVVIGAGPAGLKAAEVLISKGVKVDLYDAMPTVGRKFLMAGKGGLNLTHSEPIDVFLSRYGARKENIKPLLDVFGPESLREWVHGLGIDTFIGSSGRVFPAEMKAAPLLRAWLHRLRQAGVHFHMRHRWCGWSTDNEANQPINAPVKTSLRFVSAQGEHIVQADAVVLALGGGSWSRLGSDGAWISILAQRGVSIQPLIPANCGFDVNWSQHVIDRFAGQPVKSVSLTFTDAAGNSHQKHGDLIVTEKGVEGSLIYAVSALLRDEISANGFAEIYLDLAPGKSMSRIIAEINHPRGSRSMSSHLQSRANIKGVKTGLLRELIPAADFNSAERLAAAIKALPLKLISPRPLDEAISSAGGVAFEALDEHLMLQTLPGVFCAGEMLDWEAPTGGYLLTACFASGHCAGIGALKWLDGTEANLEEHTG